MVRGVVQGVGFRPFVYRTARSCGLSGWVLNQSDRVCIEVQGAREHLATFVETLRSGAPVQARVDAVEVQEITCRKGLAQPFEIRGSSGQAMPRPVIPADLCTCPECLAEIHAPSGRRSGYPFTNCTQCGPRWSIIMALPYDRPQTSMARFPLCASCRAEYLDPNDRRFHAQPIACPECGPALRLIDRDGRELAVRGEALAQAAAMVLSGQIVAIQGLGGFQLLVDACNSAAVAELRRRKRRPDRPLALMFPTLANMARYCHVSAEESQILASSAAPILLLQKKPAGSPPLAAAVAPDNPRLGAMLPYTPLHHLFLAAIDRPVVCTSGNLSEEPMAIAIDDALERLGRIADVFLIHDRPIVRPVDDSVGQLGPDGLQLLRRARGYAPAPIALGFDAPTVLAVGGHLKNTVALALGAQAVLSPHIGDLDNVLGVELHRRTIADLLEFFQAAPDAIACDLHPDYASTHTAQTLAAEWGVPLIHVQHHHAHVASCVAEHQLQGPVLGLSWDGTGYGGDGTAWGGEALLCDGASFVRAAHLRPFPLPGGDRAARQPRRSALGVLFAVDPELAAQRAAAWFPPSELKTLLSLLGRSIHAPMTSSVGRLFDAVAAICGLSRGPTNDISFEGQVAMALQFAAEEECEPSPSGWHVPEERRAWFDTSPRPSLHSGTCHPDAYPFPLSAAAPAVADWEPLVRAVLADRDAGVSTGCISARFHHSLAALAEAIARRVGCRQVALTGGCFQNVLLAQRVRDRLRAAGFSVTTQQQVPPGDGGIALGQILIAARQLRS